MTSKIPKIFHAFWGGPPMPPHLAAYLEEWKSLHPDWEFHLWTPDNLPTLRNQDLFDHPEKYSPVSNPWQWRSDLARYELLHDIGGLYIDADLEPLKRVDPLLGSHEAIAAREDRVFINNAFLGSAPGGRYMKAILHGLRASVLAQPRSRVNKQIGAHYITRVARRCPAVKILPSRLIYPVHWSELENMGQDTPGAYTKHRWHNRTTLKEKGSL
jgi:mannosyltransferase OCH1-like enzyme